MANTNIPELPPTQSLPKQQIPVEAETQNTMPDIIDSLKRLERVGSENSKTTQKLISAASELSQLIVKYFGDENCCVAGPLVDDPWGEPEPLFKYQIDGGRLINVKRDYLAVDQSRDDALAFSKDIASGLLDYVIATLEKRTAETAQGLPALEDALAKLKASKA